MPNALATVLVKNKKYFECKKEWIFTCFSFVGFVATGISSVHAIFCLSCNKICATK